MSPTTSRPVRALELVAAAALLAVSCGTSGADDPAPGRTSPVTTATASASEPLESSGPPAQSDGTTPASPGPTEEPGRTTAPPTAPSGLVTHTGTAADAAFEFEHPVEWGVEGEFTDVGGTVTVVDADGAPVGQLSVLVAWGAECGPGCTMLAVAHLGDLPGGAPLSDSGGFVVRTLAMDLSADPALGEAHGWTDDVRLVSSLTDAEAPVPTGMLPHVMHGLGSVETGVLATNGITHRTVVFSTTRDFGTMEEAEEYARSEEHQQVREMIASFRG